MPDRGAAVLVVGSCGRETGGIAQYIRGQARTLGDRFVVSLYDTGSPAGKEAVAAGGLGKYAWLLAATLSALARALRFPVRPVPDLVHVHASSHLSFYRESVYVLVGVLAWRRPVVLHVHGSDFDSFLAEAGPLRSWYVRAVFALAADVIVLSEYWADVVGRDAGVEDPTVIPNPVAFDSFPGNESTAEPHVVFVANLIDRKGVEEFVAAISRLLARPDLEFRVTVAGDGPRRAVVEELAATSPVVTYEGYVSEDRKRDLLAEGSLYVLPTHAEGLPISLLEGMAGENAVVSTDVGAIPEVVGPENGLVHPPGDVDRLADAIEALLVDDDRRRAMARANRTRIAESYTWETVGADLAALYDRLLSGRATDDGAAPDPGHGAEPRAE